MPKYRILPGRQFGLHRGGEIVEHEAKDAAPYVGTHLELVTGAEAKTVQVASVPLPAELARFVDMNADDTIQAAKGLAATERRVLLAWERANKRRVTIIGALEAE
jgi:acyl CoA:acetate/3-ketoacid CoA transferase beta subunit